MSGAWFARYTRNWAEETGASWAVTGGEVLGRIALGSLNLDDGESGCGYWVLPAAGSARVAARALAAVSDWALGATGFHRLHLDHSTRNAASCLVAVRAGFGGTGRRSRSVTTRPRLGSPSVSGRWRCCSPRSWPRRSRQPTPGVRFGIMAAVVLLFAAVPLDRVALAAVALIGALLYNGFLENSSGNLSWHADDLWRLMLLVLVGALGLAVGGGVRFVRDRRGRNATERAEASADTRR